MPGLLDTELLLLHQVLQLRDEDLNALNILLGELLPDQTTLEAAYRRAWKRAALQKEIDKARAAIEEQEIVIPDDLAQTVRDGLHQTSDDDDAATAWDLVIANLARERQPSD